MTSEANTSLKTSKEHHLLGERKKDGYSLQGKSQLTDLCSFGEEIANTGEVFKEEKGTYYNSAVPP